MQKPLKELKLKRLWSSVRSNNNNLDSQNERGQDEVSCEEGKPSTPHCSLPLLQVWPSSESPRGEADGQSFIFPDCQDDVSSGRSTLCENSHLHDSGIDSNQVSPLPLICGSNSATASPTPSFRRPSTGFLHPYHAKYPHLHPLSSPEHTSVEDVCEATRGNNGVSASTSSSASSLTSVAAAAISGVISRRTSDNCEPERRPSAITTRYSLFDALDLEYALLKAAARGSVGPYSLSESIHKLTFTQSLAFPALARGLASKRKRSRTDSRSRPINPTGSGLNTFAKVVTASVLVLVSVLVFAVVYKFVRT
ncbi:uncharacterized protein LOC108740022 isoform X2 [Agrilus planipennis]|uniref:Uncharacterized protein LOC108740022 isoform X2 n=1 Tax=Agrilus planipennis TaxID=224129 RepID=A0A7F5R0K0_AGRPL|nr:uncharacterized protein LOC108740022 isoform X2 [Agrilus planipennis]